MAKTNAAAFSIINRENYHEVETISLRGNEHELELMIEEKLIMYEALNRVVDGVGGDKSSCYDPTKKPASESKSVQALAAFNGDRAKFPPSQYF